MQDNNDNQKEQNSKQYHESTTHKKQVLVRSHVKDLRAIGREIKSECESRGIVASTETELKEIARKESGQITGSNAGRALSKLRSDGTIKACYKLLDEFIEPILMK